MANPKKIFSQIYDNYVDKIYRFIFFKVNSPEVAEDLCSETFLRGWQRFKNQKSKIKNQKEIENPQAFLYQIARNLVTDYYREKVRADTVPVDCVPIVDSAQDLETEFMLRSDLNEIKGALANLKENYQEVIIWHYIDDFSIPEIAKMLNKSEGAVRVTLHRALKALKNRINQS